MATRPADLPPHFDKEIIAARPVRNASPTGRRKAPYYWLVDLRLPDGTVWTDMPLMPPSPTSHWRPVVGDFIAYEKMAD